MKALGERFRQNLFGCNLNLLLQRLQVFVQIPDKVRQACARLNRYYIPTRYPNAFDRGAPVDQFFEHDAREAVRDAELVVQFAQNIVGSP